MSVSHVCLLEGELVMAAFFVLAHKCGSFGFGGKLKSIVTLS